MKLYKIVAIIVILFSTQSILSASKKWIVKNSSIIPVNCDIYVAIKDGSKRIWSSMKDNKGPIYPNQKISLVTDGCIHEILLYVQESPSIPEKSCQTGIINITKQDNQWVVLSE